MKIWITGSVSFDHIMSMPGKFSDYLMPDKLHVINVSFLMETFRQEQGGTAGNQAYTLALFKFKPIILSCVGKDFKKYRARLIKTGVSVSRIKVNRKKASANGFCMTDKNDNQIWGFYSGAMEGDKNLSLADKLKPEDLAVLTPTDPKATEKFIQECSQYHYRYLFDPAFQIPRLSQKSLQLGVSRAEIVVGNDYEIALLKRKVKLNPTKILITTLGEKGSLIQKENQQFRIPAAKPKNVKDPTGAGDAYRAGFLAGYLKNLPLEVCGRMGALAAVYTVEKIGTQTHKFSLTEFKKRYKSNFKENLKYEI